MKQNPEKQALPPLLAAVYLNAQEQVKDLLKKSDTDVNAAHGWDTPLMVAAWLRNYTIAKILLGHRDINPNATGLYENTALFIAVWNGDIRMVRILLRHPDTDAQKALPNGMTPQSLAEQIGFNFIAGLIENHLQKKGLQKNVLQEPTKENAYLDALYYNQIDYVRFVLKNQTADPNQIFKQYYGSTPLLIASFRGFTQLVKILLKAGADPNIQGTGGLYTAPLAVAVQENHLDIAKMLLAANANCNVIVTLCIPLLSAVYDNHYEMVDLLVSQKDIAINVSVPEGYTALMLAASNESIKVFPKSLDEDPEINLKIARRLLAHPEINVNKTGPWGVTALFLAAESGNEAMVRLLLEHKADPEIAQMDGLTPLDIAKAFGYTGVVDQLEKAMGPARPRKPRVLVPVSHEPPMQAVRELVSRNDYLPEVIFSEEGMHTLLSTPGLNHRQILAGLLKNKNLTPEQATDYAKFLMAYAIRHNNAEILNLLLTNRQIGRIVSPMEPLKDGKTPYDLALEEHRFDLAVMILKEWLMPMQPNEKIRIFLKAVKHADITRLKVLLATQQISPAPEILEAAIQSEHPEILKLILDDPLTVVDLKTMESLIPVLNALEKQESLKTLLNHPKYQPDNESQPFIRNFLQSVKEPDFTLEKALFNAIELNNLRGVRLLLSRMPQNYDLKNALLLAAEKNQIVIVIALLKEDRLSPKNRYDLTRELIMTAGNQGHFHLVLKILDQLEFPKDDPIIVTNLPALIHMAYEKNQWDAVVALTERVTLIRFRMIVLLGSAIVNGELKFFNTLFNTLMENLSAQFEPPQITQLCIFAISQNREDILNTILKENDLDPDLKDNGVTPLYMAIIQNNPALVNIILQKNPETDPAKVRMDNGNTALDLALEVNNHDILHALFKLPKTPKLKILKSAFDSKNINLARILMMTVENDIPLEDGLNKESLLSVARRAGNAFFTLVLKSQVHQLLSNPDYMEEQFKANPNIERELKIRRDSVWREVKGMKKHAPLGAYLNMLQSIVFDPAVTAKNVPLNRLFSPESNPKLYKSKNMLKDVELEIEKVKREMEQLVIKKSKPTTHKIP